MKNFRLVLIISFLSLFSCNSDKDEKAPEIRNEDQYVYIKGVIEEPGATYLDLDYIQFLLGDSAVAAARRMGDLDTALTSEGVVREYVTDGYYILNENDKLRRMPVAANCKYELLLNIDRLNKIADNSFESFKRVYQDSPYLLTIRNGEIIRIEEVYVP